MIDITGISIAFDYRDSELAEINRNLNMLYSTQEGTAPLDRQFGINQNYVSYPTEAAKTMFTLELIEKTVRYEPRVKVKEVTFTEDTNGLLKPNILLSKGGV